MSVLDAVVPVAGLSTRLLPLTKALPKALLPLAGRPVLEHVLEELATAGIERVVVVAGPRDEAIARHLAPDPQLAAVLTARGRDATLAGARGAGLEVEIVTQPEPLGLGDALSRAAPALGGRRFVLALGDAVLTGDVVARLAAQDGAVAIAVEEVTAARVGSYGIVDASADGTVRALVEKPRPDEAPSRLAVAARYVADGRLLDALAAVPPTPDGGGQLAAAITALLAAGERVVAVPLLGRERRLDVGTLDGYAAAVAALGA